MKFVIKSDTVRYFACSVLYNISLTFALLGIPFHIQQFQWLIAKKFPEKIEDELAKYCEESAIIYYDLSIRKVRKQAYEYAMKNSILVRQNWHTISMSFTDWVS